MCECGRKECTFCGETARRKEKNMEKCIICDIDGTIALMKGKRSPFEYEKAFDDEPNQPVIDVLMATVYHYECKYEQEIWIIFTSARENRELKNYFSTTSYNDGNQIKDVGELTKAWVERHIGVSKWNKFIFREAGDYRKDAFVKFEIGKEIMKEYDILCVFDDRNQVVDMWRNGLQVTCFQVADGNF